MDTSAFLVIAVFLVALVVAAVGVYIILVLRDIRKNLDKTYRILEKIDSLIVTFETRIAGPTTTLVGVFSAIKEGLKLFRSFTKEGEEE